MSSSHHYISLRKNRIAVLKKWIVTWKWKSHRSNFSSFNLYTVIYKSNDSIQTTHWQQLQSANAHKMPLFSETVQKLRALIRHSLNSFSHVATAKFVRTYRIFALASNSFPFGSQCLPTLLTNRTFVHIYYIQYIDSVLFYQCNMLYLCIHSLLRYANEAAMAVCFLVGNFAFSHSSFDNFDVCFFSVIAHSFFGWFCC